MNADNFDQHSTVNSAVEEKIDSPQSPDLRPDSGSSDPGSPQPKRRFWVPALIGLALLGGVGWIVFQRVILPMMLFGQMPPQLTKVQLSQPKSATIENTSDYSATLDSRQSVAVRPRVAGQIDRLLVKAGDRVEPSQILAQLDDSTLRGQYTQSQGQLAAAQASLQRSLAGNRSQDIAQAQSQVNEAQAGIPKAQAQLAQAQANLQKAQTDFERSTQLFNQGAINRRELDTDRQTYEVAKAQIRVEQEALRQAQAQWSRSKQALSLQQAGSRTEDIAAARAEVTRAEGMVQTMRAQLNDMVVRAPFGGIVGDIPVKQGDMVTTAEPLLTLTQNQTLEVQLPVPLEEAPRLKLGLPVKLLDDRDRPIHTGRISFIAPNVDASTQSVQVKAAFPNANNSLRTSQFVRARLVWSNRPGVVVPTTAISRLGGKDFIFVATPYSDAAACQNLPATGAPPMKLQPTDLVAVQKPLQLGKIVGNDQEVLSGLKASDRIIANGIMQLQNCMPITQ